MKVSYKSFTGAADELERAKLVPAELAERIRQLEEERETACFESDPDWRAEVEEEFLRDPAEIITLWGRA